MKDVKLKSGNITITTLRKESFDLRRKPDPDVDYALLIM